eukprot:s28_g5.t1
MASQEIFAWKRLVVDELHEPLRALRDAARLRQDSSLKTPERILFHNFESLEAESRWGLTATPTISSAPEVSFLARFHRVFVPRDSDLEAQHYLDEYVRSNDLDVSLSGPNCGRQASHMASPSTGGFQSPADAALTDPVSPTAAVTQLIDTKAIGRLRTFDGKEDSWPTWAFVARSYLCLLDVEYGRLIKASESASRHTDIDFASLSQPVQEKAVVLFNLLTQSVEGRALQVMMNVEAGNGFQAWKALCETYEPSVGGRHTAMLIGIIAPSWENVRDAEFLEAIETWEVQIRRYEVQSQEAVSNSMKIAVLMKHAPPSVRAALRTASSTIGSDYTRAKVFVRDFLQSGVVYTSAGDAGRADDKGPAPMDVGAVQKGDKGKKGKKGKGEKGVNKGSKWDKSAGKAPQYTKKFQGECSHCGKWGHKKADCRLLAKEKAQREKQKGAGAGKGTNALSSTDPAAASSTNAVHYWVDPHEAARQPWADVEDGGDGYQEEKWVMAVHGEDLSRRHAGSVKFLLWDSGSDEHLCRPQFGGDAHTRPCGAKLMGISGTCLGELGEKRVRYKIVAEAGFYVHAETRFKVSQNASKDVLSAGKMCQAGFAADFRELERPCLVHSALGFRIPLYMHNNSYYLKIIDDEAVPSYVQGNLQCGVFVAPVVSQGEAYDWEYAGADADEDEGIEAVPLPEAFARDEAHARADRPRLHGWSKVEDMRARLRELGEPIYGEKAVLWKRLQRAEAELNARRAAARDFMDKNAQRQQALREGREPDVQLVPAAVGPTDEERERHNVLHIPPQPWCEFCIRGHGIDDAHKRKKTEEKLGENHFELDYSFLKANTALASSFEECSDTVLSIVDSGTNMGLAFCIPAKNIGIPYVVRVITSFIIQLGYTTVKLRSDNEPVIKKVVRDIAEALRSGKAPGAEGLKITFEETPRYSSQSLGTMGAFQKLLRQDVLTLRYAVEAAYGITLHTSHNLWPWLVRWCSFLRSRFAVKGNQRTAYQDAFDTAYTTPILPFAETVLFKIPTSKARRSHSRTIIPKGDTTWRQGIYLGRSVTSNETLLGTEEGTISARSVRRFADVTKRHNKELMSQMIGVPWDQGTTIGRPKRARPLPVLNLIPEEREAEDDRAEEAEVRVEESANTDDIFGDDVPLVSGDPSSGSGRQPEQPVGMEGVEARADERAGSARRAWPGDVEAEEGASSKRMRTEAAKKARVAALSVCSLFSPVEDIIVDEDAVEEACDELEDDEENKPISEEELHQGMMEEFRKMDFYDTYEVVPYEPGMKLLDATWVNKRKPDGSVRCRYCVREFKRGDPRTDVFAVASSTSTSRLVDLIGLKMGYAFMTADAENAFWQVPIKEKAYMVPPKEWSRKRMAEHGPPKFREVWRLKVEWYGRRIAGQSFVEWAASHLSAEDFKRCLAAPWLFFNSTTGVVMEVHMDDFYATGPLHHLQALEVALKKRIKMKTVIHPMEEGVQFSHLKRTRLITKDGIFLTPRKKYIEDLLKLLGLETCNPAPTPYPHTEVKDGEKLSAEAAKKYRAATGIALYLSYDRTDIQFSVRELTKDMKDPCDGSMFKLHRLARYLNGTRDHGVWLKKDGEMQTLTIHSDTDWANCKKTRKSCACAMLRVGNCLLYSYARSLQMLCLSSVEAEFNGGVAACSEGLFLKELFAFVGQPVNMEVYLDSSAARGVFQRQGVGRIRHLEVKSLWVQDALHRKLFTLHAVHTQQNTADLGTKGLPSARFHELRKMIGIGDLEEFVSDANMNSSNVTDFSGMSKKALLVALLSYVHGAKGHESSGGAYEFAVERIADKAALVGSFVKYVSFDMDLFQMIVILLLIQSLMLLGCVWYIMRLTKGLSQNVQYKKTIGMKGQGNVVFERILWLEGREVFHVAEECPLLAKRTRGYETVRICEWSTIPIEYHLIAVRHTGGERALYLNQNSREVKDREALLQICNFFSPDEAWMTDGWGPQTIAISWCK